MGSNPKHVLVHGAECRKSCALCAGTRGVAWGLLNLPVYST